MKVPKHINIAGVRVPIIWGDMPDSDGEWDYESRTIRLNPRLRGNPVAVRATLIHEALHAVLDFAGLSSRTSGAISLAREEQLVTAIESLASPAIHTIYQY